MATLKKPRRKRIGKGIYRDRYGLSAAVKVGNGRRGTATRALHD